MTEKTTEKTACPNCSTTYRLPESILGKTVACKRCGTRFKAIAGAGKKSIPIIAKLALKHGMITQEQLKVAAVHRTKHASTGQEIPLEKILQAKGFLTQAQTELLHLAQKYWQVTQLGRGFCQIALKKKLITPQDARAAIQAQSAAFKKNKSVRRISEILLEDGKITAEQCDSLLADQGRRRRDQNGDPPSKKTATEAVSPAESTAPAAPAAAREAVPATTGEDAQATPEETAGATSPDPGSEFDLSISRDRLSAVIRPAGGMPAANTLEYVHDLLNTHGITTGILPDERITEYMKTEALEGAPLTIARGKPPKPGIDATLTYHFQAQQKIGKVLAGGTMDYRDHGEVPFVKKGDLLVEKTPMTPGEPGTDISGEPIKAGAPADVKLRNGAGTELIENGLKLIAQADGQPKMSFGGRVTVLSELKIDGDVDLKTGHVNFEGNVDVAGSIQAKFRVKAHHLTAREIMAAEVTVTGDITVGGGIIGATINSQGNIRAKYIKNANISAFGSVTAEREITDSTIEVSGSCQVENGKIFASTISAKQGIQAKDIGTEVSTPCRLSAGVDTHIEQEISGLQNAINRRKEKQKQIKQNLVALDVEKQAMQQQISLLAQVQDRSMVEQRDVQSTLEKLKAVAQADAVAEAENKIKALEQKARDAENELGALFDKQDQADEKIGALELELKMLQEEIDELTDEKQSIVQWSKAQKPIAVVSATGPVYAGTMISGVHAQTRIKETCRHVRIHEVKVTNPDAATEWDIRISPFK